MSTHGLYTFKIMQKTNIMILELHTYISQQSNSPSFVSNDPGHTF
jgi:hypothetical protein